VPTGPATAAAASPTSTTHVAQLKARQDKGGAVKASPAADQVRAVAAAAAAGAGLVLEDITITPVGRRRLLRVVVDLPQDETGGVPMDRVAAASQALSRSLDRDDVMGQAPYVLEVTSPGVDRPLTERRHYLRARGRLVRLVLAGGRTASGRLVDVTPDGLVLDGAATIALAEVVRGRVEVEFSGDESDEEA
jgi:ribosome maturation factor RimP